MANKQLVFDILANDKASATIRGVSDEFDRQGSRFGAWQAAGVAAAGAVLAGVVKFGTDSVQAFSESQTAQQGLAFAFEQFPALADTNIAALQELNAELARKTGLDDDATAAAQANLAQYGLTGEQITQLTPLMQDFAVKTGQDLPGASEALGKALLGQGRALKEIGIDFTDAGSTGANFDQIMAGLSAQVGGYATDQAQTAAGQTAILADQFGELQETVGEKLLPVMSTLVDVGLKIVDWISQNVDWLAPLAVLLGGVAAGVLLWTGYQWALNAALTANPIGIVVVALVALVAGIIWAWNNVDWFRNGLTSAWKWISDKTSALVSAVSGFLGDLGDNVRGVWNNITTWSGNLWRNVTGFFGRLRDGVSRAFQSVLDVGKRVFSWTPIGLIITNWDRIVGFFRGLPGKIAAATRGMWNGLTSSFRAAVNTLIRGWNRLSFTLGGGEVLGIAVPSVTLNTPNIPLLAAGGVATRATLAVVGEGRSSEAILPFDRASEFAAMVAQSLGGGATVSLAGAEIVVVDADGALIGRMRTEAQHVTGRVMDNQTARVLARPRR